MQLFEALEPGHVLDRPAADVSPRRPDRGLQLTLRLPEGRVRRLARGQDHRAHAEDGECGQQSNTLPEHHQPVQQLQCYLGSNLGFQ